MSLAHFFSALKAYAHTFQQATAQVPIGNMSPATFGATARQQAAMDATQAQQQQFYTPAIYGTQANVLITRDELEGLLCWLALVKKLAQQVCIYNYAEMC